MSETAAVSVEELSFSYGDITVLEKVSFTMERGSFITMVGPNGGGKTTLLKLMLGLIRPHSGLVRVFGKPPEKSREKIGYMPQHQLFDPWFPVTASDVVLMGRLGIKSPDLKASEIDSPKRKARGRKIIGLYSKDDRNRASEALGIVGMADYEKRPFSSLSGGQRQRVLLARALVSAPQLLLLDEPTANVDMEVETRLTSILEDLGRRMTILMVTHDLGFVSGLVQSCICVNRRVFVHPTSEISGEVLQRLYGQDLRIVRHDKLR
jgi:zinc transport system ATP-binding protein